MTNPQFSDIRGHWAQAAIEALVARGVISGYPDQTVRPDAPVSRAEYAAMLMRAFPDVDPIRASLVFADVPDTHWAGSAIQWAYTRGFLSGYPNALFKPEEPLTRAMALVALAGGLRLGTPAGSKTLLREYFADAAEIPEYFEGAIAAATVNRLVVNFPYVSHLRPNDNARRGEVAAFLAQALQIPDAVPQQFVAWRLRLADLAAGKSVRLDELRTQPFLVKELQIRLAELGLYPGGTWIDGVYGPRTEGAIAQFANARGLPTMQTRVLNQAFAEALLTTHDADLKLEQARDRQRIFQEYLDQERGYGVGRLAFLNRGISQSPYRNEIITFPDRIKEKPDGQEVVSWGKSLTPKGGGAPIEFRPYPKRGELPGIDEGRLSFLHPDIQQACVCIGSFVDGQIYAHWMGRNALSNVELWSATKLVPILNVVSQANVRFPSVDVDDTIVRARDNTTGYSFYNLMVDVISYGNGNDRSNQVAALFKRFSTVEGLEQWMQALTGNKASTFRGRYGLPPLINFPELWHPRSRQVLLSFVPVQPWGENSVATYDLVRLITMLGWHHHLPVEAKIPGAQWSSLESVVRAMGTDSARYLDVAIARLGMNTAMRSPVILSKLGNGYTTIRNRTEIAYLALVQFVDQRLKAQGEPAKLRTVAMCLLGARATGDTNQQATQLDARMAAEVTEILRRVVTEEL
ncbi:MAG: S-layer homology domain-containing protein [Synechococcales bacterium]|nr:S-layer homology domain-containing protein [Synechococcales bacterium]